MIGPGKIFYRVQPHFSFAFRSRAGRLRSLKIGWESRVDKRDPPQTGNAAISAHEGTTEERMLKDHSFDCRVISFANGVKRRPQHACTMSSRRRADEING